MLDRAIARVVQRRLYWLLDPSSPLVLVHYLQLPDATVYQQLPPPQPAFTLGGDMHMGLIPSLESEENETRAPNRISPIRMTHRALPVATAKAAHDVLHAHASSSKIKFETKLTRIAAASPEVAICGCEFTLLIVLAAPIQADEPSVGPLFCIFGQDKVPLSPCYDLLYRTPVGTCIEPHRHTLPLRTRLCFKRWLLTCAQYTPQALNQPRNNKACT